MEKADELIKNARAQYTGADAIGRKVLEEVFGKETFTSTNYVQVWDEFQKEFKKDVQLPFDKDTKDREEQRTNSFHMLNVIVPAERGNWEPNYDDGKWKYQPAFDLSGSGFAYSDCDFWNSDTACSSRLCTPSENECIRIAKKYLPIYERCYNK